MYDHLVGTVLRKEPASVVLRVGGVGYDVRTSMGSAEQVRLGSEATLFTHLHVVDGVPTLLGFATRGERDLCRKLLSVSGVGPSIALALLSGDAPARLVRAIEQEDVGALRKVKGIGPKTASRICLELKESLRALVLDDAGPGGRPADRTEDDAVAALVTLGFADREARRRIATLRKAEPTLDAEHLIRRALQEEAAS